MVLMQADYQIFGAREDIFHTVDVVTGCPGSDENWPVKRKSSECEMAFLVSDCFDRRRFYAHHSAG